MFIPIANNFFTLKVDIINVTADGWLREHFKEHIIASFDIRIPDLKKEPFKSDGSIRLPFSKVDYKKLGLVLIGQVQGASYLEIQLVDMTRGDAMIVYNPNRDITAEERTYKADYSIKEANVVLTRARLSI